MKPKRNELLTVGELRSHLEGIPDEAVIFFGCESLRFNRIKRRGENFYQIEFSQLVCDDEDGNVYVDELPPSKPKRK